MTEYQRVEALAVAAGFKSYQDYLQSDHWKELKRQRGMDRCCVCATERGLLGHHIRYRNLLDVVPEDIEPMCGSCHEDFHMACRKQGFNYIDMGPTEIAIWTTRFRKTDWYKKWTGRRFKKAERKLHKQVMADMRFVIVARKFGQEHIVMAIPVSQKAANKIVKQVKPHMKGWQVTCRKA